MLTGLKKIQEYGKIKKMRQISEREDFKRTSDIDIAVTGGDIARFSLDVDEQTSTLLMYDIVNLDWYVQDDLLEVIKKGSVK